MARIKRVQQIIGSLLYYARAVDNTILVTLNIVTAEQSQATTDTEKQIHKLLNYVATHHNASITYKASDMILKIHRDASYVSAKNSRSRAGGYFYMGKNNDFINAPVHVECNIMKNVLASAAEAEIGAIFLNCQLG